jgi:ribosomal protein S18 acetylase RimI-like enzyme
MPHIYTHIATLSDLHTAAALFDAYRQFYAQPANLALATQFLADRIRQQESVIILAQDENQMALGFCQLYPSFCSVEAVRIYTLYDLYVAPQGRRLGIGKQLLLAAHAHAQQQGMARMDLTTAKTNLTAQALYVSLGWVRDDVFYAYSKQVIFSLT